MATFVADTPILPPAEATVIRTHLATFTKRPADALVFTSTTGKPLDVCHLQERGWRRARKLAFPDPHRSGDDAIAACYPAPFELPLDHP